MKKLLIIVLLFIPLLACSKAEVREFEQKIEIFEEATIINDYLKLAKEEGFKYYSFIDIRAYEGESNGYAKTKSYSYGYIDFFDSVPWGDSFGSKLSKLMKDKPKSYPVIIIDYDGSYIEDCIKFLEKKGYTNIKAFKNGFFDTENNYIDQLGFAHLKKVENCGC